MRRENYVYYFRAIFLQQRISEMDVLAHPVDPQYETFRATTRQSEIDN